MSENRKQRRGGCAKQSEQTEVCESRRPSERAARPSASSFRVGVARLHGGERRRVQQQRFSGGIFSNGVAFRAGL
jgi:hypothetical protein